MNPDKLLMENSVTLPQQRKQSQPNQNQMLSKKPSCGADTPKMGLDKLFPEDFSNRATLSAQHASSHESLNAPANLLRSAGDASSKRSPGGSDTPEMNLDKPFPEGQPPSRPKKSASSFLKDTPTRQDTPEMNLGYLFEEQPAAVTQLLPGHAHLVPVHRPKMYSDKSEDAQSDDPFDYHQHMCQPRDSLRLVPQQQSNKWSKPANQQGTPEMNLSSLFPDNNSALESSQLKKPSSPLKGTPTRQDTPEMNLNNLFPESQSSSQPKKNASFSLSTLTRQDTPEVNLNSLLPEDQSPSQAKKKPSSTLKDTPTRQDTPEMNLDKLFLESQSSQPKNNASSLLKDTPTRQDSPELNLNGLFREDQSSSKLKKSASSSLGILTRQDTPEMDLNSQIAENQSPLLPSKNISSTLRNIPTLFLENKLPSQTKKSTSSSLKDPLTRQDTPEMNLDKLFHEDKSVLIANTPADHPTSVRISHGIAQPLSGDSSKPVSISLENLLDDSDASSHSPYDSPVDTEAMPLGQPSSHSAVPGEPTAHLDEKDAHAPAHSAAGKTKLPSMSHLPAMPSISMQFFSAKKADAPAQSELSSVSASQLPSVSASQLPSVSASQIPSVNAPLINIPELSTIKASSTSAHELPTLSAPLVIVPLPPTLSHSSISAPELPSAPGLPTVTTNHFGGIRGMMPSVSSTTSSSRHPPPFPEDQTDLPRGDALRHENPSLSNIGDVIEVHRVAVKPHPVAIFRADIPKGEKRPGKRARKAQRKHDATKRHSIMDTISTALVGRKKNSVSSPVMRLNELFDEPMVMTLPASSTPATPLLGGIRGRLPSVSMPSLSSVHMPTMPAVPYAHMPSMPAMPALPSVHLPALPEMHMPALALPHLPKLGAAATRDVSSVAITLPKPKPSTAAAIKVPKIDATLLPEEQANYPRGDIRRRENPAPSHVEDIVEVKKLHLPADLSVLKLSSATVHDVSSVTVPLPRHKPSKAAAIKIPKVEATLLPEEQANYPRGDIQRRENPAPSHVEDIVEVKRLRLPAPLPLDAELPVVAAAVPAISMPSIHMPTLPSMHLPSLPSVSLPSVKLPTLPEAHLPEVHMPTLPAMPAMPTLHMPTLPKFTIPSMNTTFIPHTIILLRKTKWHTNLHITPAFFNFECNTDNKSLVDEEENYCSADDEPTSVITRKTVVTEPARVIPKIAAPVPAPVEVVAPIVTQRTTTVVTEPAARVIPKIAAVAAPIVVDVPVVTHKTVVTEPTRVVPQVKKIPIAQPPIDVMKTRIPQPPVEAEKFRVAQPPLEVANKIPIAHPPVGIKKIPFAQPVVVVKSTDVNTTTPTAPASAVSKIEVTKPVVQETKEVKIMATPKPEPNVRKPPVDESYTNEHRHTMVVEPKVDDFKLTGKIDHAPRPVIPAMIEAKKVVETHAPKIVDAPKPIIVETHKVAESPDYINAETHKILEAHKVIEAQKVAEVPKAMKAASPAPIPVSIPAPVPAPIPAPRPEPTITKTTVSTTKTADPIPVPRPVVAAAAVAPVFLHHQDHKEAVAPTPVQTEEKKHDTTMISKTAVVELAPQPAQQIKQVVEEVHHHGPIPQSVQVQQVKAVADEHHQPQPQPQPQIQQQQIIQQQPVAATPVEALLNRGERIILVQKLTTVKYYNGEDEDELDELGYRKDRDVSLHIGPMPTAVSRRNSLQAYRERKNSGVSSLDANIAALHRQDAMNSRRSSLAEPLQQQHPHFYEQQATNQIPLHDLHQQHQQYQVVQQQVYNTQPRNPQQQQQPINQQQPQHAQQNQQNQQQQQHLGQN